MEQIWFLDLPGMFTESNYFTIWPSQDMSFEVQLNALVRFSIYFAIIVFLIKKDMNIFFIPIFVGAFTYFIYSNDQSQKKVQKELFDSMNQTIKKDGKICEQPTLENPFMNVLMSDYTRNAERPAACEMTKPIQRKVKNFFDEKLIRDVDDIFHNNASDRQFYTNPVTTIPNDQTQFAKWLYGSGKTCKEGNGDKCYRNMNRSVNV